jgi:hypothetical protein
MSSAARRREYPATTTSLLCANDEQGDGQSTPDFVSFGAMLFPLTTATAIISAALSSPFDAKNQLNRLAEAPRIND